MPQRSCPAGAGQNGPAFIRIPAKARMPISATGIDTITARPHRCVRDFVRLLVHAVSVGYDGRPRLCRRRQTAEYMDAVAYATIT